eukprot:TRINITY_DN5127_c0_g2_i3.p1 TRINITY_DN5127_c0_g2~~TRINITY_DN5127_c0_g2_i3.p1  ORF type:complete len:181 (+),score=13.22 TRINITY_DN5127_c0_g2_i3:223-765(+)
MAVPSTALKIVVFYGSSRPGRLCDRVGKYVVNQLQERGHQVDIVDPIELKLPVLEKPHFFYAPGTAPPELDRVARQILDADGYVVVSGEYNHSIPPALTNTMSHFGGSKYKFRPGTCFFFSLILKHLAAIVTYSAGQWGGMRAAMQLRSFLGELGCLSTSNILAFAFVRGDENYHVTHSF